MTTSTIEPATPAPEKSPARKPSTSKWNHDAVRIAEQIKRQTPRRPATILIGGLEESRHARVIAAEVSQSLAILSAEPVLFLDAEGAVSPLASVIEEKIPLAGRPVQLQKLLAEIERAGTPPNKAQGALVVSQLVTDSDGSEDPAQLISPENMAAIEKAGAHFPLTILHSIPFSYQESYALLAKADFILIVVSKGESSYRNLERLYNQCQTITDAPLAAVLAF